MSAWTRAVMGALLISLLGAAVGLAWNGLNPRGIPLVAPAPADGTERDPAAAGILGYDAVNSIPETDWITVEAAHALWRDGTVKVVDARPAAEFEARRIPDARNIHEKRFGPDLQRHMGWLEFRLPGEVGRFPDGYPIVVHCNHRYCDEARVTFQKLRELGLPNVKLMARGLDAWVAAGFPVLVRVGDRLEERAGAGVPSLADTGIPGVAPGVLFAWILAAPWIVLAVLILLARAAPARLDPVIAALAGLARVGLGLVFLYAAWFKLIDPGGFAQMVLCYEMVPLALTPLFTVCLPAVEALAALGLVAGVAVRPSALLLTVLLAAFMAAIFALMLQGVNCACGCFPGKYPVGWMRLYEDAALMLAGGLAIWRGGRWRAVHRAARPVRAPGS